MNAKEAKLTATKRAAELKEQHEEAERKRDEASAKKRREEHQNWYTNLVARVEGDIKEAVDKGKTKISVHLRTFEKREHAEKDNFMKSFTFVSELKKVIAHFEKLDYEIEFSVERYENVDLSDLNPRDNYFTYKTMLDVSWDVSW